MENFWYCAYLDEKTYMEAYLPCNAQGEIIVPKEYEHEGKRVQFLFMSMVLDDFQSCSPISKVWDEFHPFCEKNIYQNQQGCLYRRTSYQDACLLFIPVDINKLDIIEKELKEFNLSIIDKLK